MWEVLGSNLGPPHIICSRSILGLLHSPIYASVFSAVSSIQVSQRRTPPPLRTWQKQGALNRRLKMRTFVSARNPIPVVRSVAKPCPFSLRTSHSTDKRTEESVNKHSAIPLQLHLNVEYTSWPKRGTLTRINSLCNFDKTVETPFAQRKCRGWIMQGHHWHLSSKDM
jgi:hypothetical protein